MEIAPMKAIPPHVAFYSEPVENRNASIAAGHYVTDEVHHVRVTPVGSKDCHVKPVADWFAGLAQQVKEERFPSEWLDKFQSAYEYWKKGEEIPVEGTPIKNWPVASPGEVAVCVKLHVLTVEALAQANDETLRRIGMGGLALKQRAQKYLEAANGPGKVTAELQAALTLNANMTARNKELEARLAKLELLAGGISPVVVTPPKEDNAKIL